MELGKETNLNNPFGARNNHGQNLATDIGKPDRFHNS